MNALRSTLQRNLEQVRGRIGAAAHRAARDPAEITLVGVTKYVSAETARALFEAGCHDLGESRPQELWSKQEALADLPVRWHLVGRLQRNKAKRTAPRIGRLHSLDSLELARELDALFRAAGRVLPALLEVNTSGDATKHGVAPGRAAQFLRETANCSGLRIDGLMTLAHREGGSEVARGDFRRLRDLRDALQAELGPTVQLPELSMGMSGDFEVAIEEGATLVRVGSALFEDIEEEMPREATTLTIDVRVRAAARREGVSRDAAGGLRVAVHPAPERGKANAAVIDRLAEALGLRRGQIEIVAGHTSPKKRICVTGLSAAELQRRIAVLPD